jgi:SpoVK/Ycf46/Vps4 family AAA+-type ATPase
MGFEMATAEQLKALLKSYAEGDDERFLAISMQVAAHAARKGQGKFAEELRALIDEAKARRDAAKLQPLVPIARATGELAGLLSASYPKVRLADMVLAKDTREQLNRLVSEYKQQHKLRAHGLSARRKLLLVGPPGSGKTMTASALAGELNLPLLGVQLHALLTKYMAETAAKLRLIFDAMQRTRGVYLFDEFDAIGSNRNLANDVGEIRRVLNSFLQFLEQEDSDSLILAATNHVGVLDPALFRRFDDVVRYEASSPDLAKELIQNRLNVFGVQNIEWPSVLQAVLGLSYAELARACDDAARRAVLADNKEITSASLLQALCERQEINKSQEYQTGTEG